MIDVRPVAHSIGRLTAVFGALMVAPGVVDWWAGDPHWQVFAEVGLICALLGALVAIATAGRGGELMLEQAFLLTSGVWLVLPVVGALPFVMGEPHASFVDALFEAMSGMTTTGATAGAGAAGQAAVVGRPATSTLSLTANTIPASGPPVATDRS